jgi:2-keto-4-pentenoate hydratase/2-oxohepta-3-ene-1,7-dioic acid hydratase in catechol pathway
MIKLPISGTRETYTVNPSKIIALGLNYREHIQESTSVKVQGFTKEEPKEPVLFPKLPSALTGPDTKIIIPAFVKNYNFDEPRTDYEAELAIIIKKDCKNVPAAKAFDYILGYTCLNDVSQRNIQNGDRSGWFRGKSFDTFAPVGPAVLLQDVSFDPHNLRISCRLNGKTVQDSNTSLMIFQIPQIIEYVSKMFTLNAGDIISTGTPAGVGPVKHGDIVEVEIEKIGVLKNTVEEA